MLSAASCVYVDQTLGSNFIPSNQLYDVSIVEFPLSDVKMGYCDSLSAYSDSRITVGAIRDSRFGLTTRSSAVTLVPVLDTIDVGTDPKPLYFHFTATRDTTSVPKFDQQKILQSVNVYELTSYMDTTYMYVWDDRYDEFYDSSTRITQGVPVYAGGDSLSFDFSTAYAEKMINLFKETPDIQLDLETYLRAMPGIYITVDPPVGEGGRINMFDVPIEVDDYGYVTGCYAELVMQAKYGDDTEPRDTSFLFYFGPVERTTDTDQYAFNICTHETHDALFEPDERGLVDAGDEIYVEGGAGLKPVFNAIEMKTLMLDELATKGLGPTDVIINKATIVMPYEEPDDYDYYYLMPDILSPTCKFSTMTGDLIKEDGTQMRYVYYAGLTDSSISDEDQGDINRSLDRYTPDITHHLQEILKISDDTLATGKYDIWMLILSAETVVTDTSNEDMSEYYQYLAYSSYYNSMYSGSYSGSSYSNYYYYLYLAEMYGSSTSTSTENVLDKDKYFTATLKGPTSDDGPKLKVSYSYIKTSATDSDSGSE
ncbi:MAG: hypothetical protein LUC24_06900 [Bacteroidales bacterium]|nr:hypothetical protein [Bacteroidales bacterium]